MKNKHPFCGKYMQKSLRCKVFGSLASCLPKGVRENFAAEGGNWGAHQAASVWVCACVGRAKFKLASSGSEKEWPNCHRTERGTLKRKWLANCTNATRRKMWRKKLGAMPSSSPCHTNFLQVQLLFWAQRLGQVKGASSRLSSLGGSFMCCISRGAWLF